MTVAEAVADLDARIVAVERALEAGEQPVLPAWADDALVGPVTAEDVAAYETAMVRLVACQARLQLARLEVLDDIAGLGRRRSAAASYSRH